MEGNDPTSNKYNLWAKIRNIFSRQGSRSNKRDSHGFSTFNSSDGSLPNSLTDVTISRTDSEAASAPKSLTDITFSRTGSEAASSPGHESSVESIEVSTEGLIEDTCVTPQNSETWNDMGISPTKLNIREAEQRMKYDEIKLEQFYIDGNQNVKGAVHFLYGIGYGSSMEQVNRINKIKEMVDEPSHNLRRISDFAFQTLDERRSPGEQKISSFLDMAVTLKLFFAKDKAFGEFYGDHFMRFQRGNNLTCWQCAACVWLSLLIRMKTKDTSDTYIVDIPQRVRRYISSNPDKLDRKIEDPVIKNAGDLTYNFAHTLFDGDCVEIDTGNDKIDLARPDLWALVQPWTHFEERMMKELIEKYGPGLINNFRLTTPFIAAAKLYKKGCGYWAFLGDSIDDVGQFVHLPELNEEHIKLKATLSDKATKQIYDATHKNRKFFPDNNANEAQTGGRSNGNDSSTTTKGKKGEEEERHSMVLLGGIVQRVWDKKRYEYVDKQHYLILNSWHRMPLVLVSAEYLEACGAEVLFRKKAVTKEQKSDFAVNEMCVAVGMASPCSTSDGLYCNLKTVFNDEYKERERNVAACPSSVEDEGDY